MLRSIDLSFSCLCNANCIYCPSDRGRDIKEKNLTLNCAKKIIDEISSYNFKRYHRINRIIIGENGGTFLNEELINILRYINYMHQNPKLYIYDLQ